MAPDVGLSAPYNSWFTLFGQFFDHGLDLVNKGGNGTVFMPLQADDPLYVDGSPTNFMVLTRATHDGDHEANNQTSPWVDQSQTYTSHPSHQVFLREYAFDARLRVTRSLRHGSLITGAGDGMATWADVKAQADNMLGIAADRRGRAQPPAPGHRPLRPLRARTERLPAVVVPASARLSTVTPARRRRAGRGQPHDPGADDGCDRTGHAFLDDIAHNAVPKAGFTPDGDAVVTPGLVVVRAARLPGGLRQRVRRRDARRALHRR